MEFMVEDMVYTLYILRAFVVIFLLVSFENQCYVKTFKKRLLTNKKTRLKPLSGLTQNEFHLV